MPGSNGDDLVLSDNVFEIKEGMMKRGAVVVMGLILMLVACGFSLTSDRKPDAGKKVFVDQKCGMCHSVEAAGIPRRPTQKNPDLSDVGSRHSASFWMNYLKKEEAMDGKKHMASFKGSTEDLEALAQWLESMKSN